MVKGFTDEKGKFHPTGNNSSKSSKEKSVKPLKGILLDKRRDKFGFTSQADQENQPEQPIRIKGNEVILKVVEAMKEKNPLFDDFIIKNTAIYNDYDDIQKTFAFSEEQVNKLLEWRNDGDPTTWKWEAPLILVNPEDEQAFGIEDNHNLGFIGDAYKGQVTIVTMTPRQFLEKACPKCLREADTVGISELDFDMRGKEKTQETIKNVTEAMMEGNSIETPFLSVNLDGLKVRSHEGRHRAFSAIQAGIEEIPVYIYTNDTMSDDIRERITNDPINELVRDERL